MRMVHLGGEQPHTEDQVSIRTESADVEVWLRERAARVGANEARSQWERRSRAYGDYVQWARLVGLAPMKSAAFKGEMKALGVRFVVYSGHNACSVRLAPPDPQGR